MSAFVRQAKPQDTQVVADILREAAHWLEQNGTPMWQEGELLPSRIVADVDAGLFFVAECDGELAGTVKFQLEDLLFWPDVSQEQSAFIHRLAVRRRFAGGRVSSALLQWAVLRTRSLGRCFLRLDCEASRLRLRAVYEHFGFRHHSDKQVGPYFVSRYEYDVTTLSAQQRTEASIVRAKPDDAAMLTDIAFAAKRHWGYPERWIESWRDVLTVRPEFIASHETYAAVFDGRIVGFYALGRKDDRLVLLHMWVPPEAMGQGVGRSMFLHGLERTRKLGCRELEIESDPNAEGFYQHMGAHRVGVSVKELDGQRRELPILIYEI